MADKHEKLSAEQIAAISEKFFAKTVVKVTAPGGKSRESVRVHFDDGTVIATQRKYPGRMRLEVEVLERLNGQGAPAPRLLGSVGQVLFQQDIGSYRLSGALAHTKGKSLTDIAAAACESLLYIQEAGGKSGLNEIVPPLGEDSSWVVGLVSTPMATAQKFEIEPPTLNFALLTDKLLVPANRFIKWDARPGNGAIGDDGRVFWFDWEHCGRRQGMEDFAWLFGDEFFPLDVDDAVAILDDLLPKETKEFDLDYLAHFIVFHIVQRLTIFHRLHRKSGWTDPKTALKYDDVGVDPDMAIMLCTHGAEWADRSDLTRPLARWFGALAARIEDLRDSNAAN